MNNKKVQQVYSGEKSYPTYDVEIQEINLLGSYTNRFHISWSTWEVPN